MVPSSYGMLWAVDVWIHLHRRTMVLKFARWHFQETGRYTVYRNNRKQKSNLNYLYSTFYPLAKTHWLNYGSLAPAGVLLRTLVPVLQANRSTIHKQFLIIPRIMFCFRTRQPHHYAHGIHGMHLVCIWCHSVTMVLFVLLYIRRRIRLSWRALMIFVRDFGSVEQMLIKIVL